MRIVAVSLARRDDKFIAIDPLGNQPAIVMSLHPVVAAKRQNCRVEHQWR